MPRLQIETVPACSEPMARWIAACGTSGLHSTGPVSRDSPVPIESPSDMDAMTLQLEHTAAAVRKCPDLLPSVTLDLLVVDDSQHRLVTPHVVAHWLRTVPSVGILACSFDHLSPDTIDALLHTTHLRAVTISGSVPFFLQHSQHAGAWLRECLKHLYSVLERRAARSAAFAESLQCVIVKLDASWPVSLDLYDACGKLQHLFERNEYLRHVTVPLGNRVHAFDMDLLPMSFSPQLEMVRFTHTTESVVQRIDARAKRLLCYCTVVRDGPEAEPCTVPAERDSSASAASLSAAAFKTLKRARDSDSDSETDVLEDSDCEAFAESFSRLGTESRDRKRRTLTDLRQTQHSIL